MLMLLGWVYLLLPLVCWAVVMRTRVVGVAVFAVLAGLAMVLVGLECDWYFTRATAEIEAGYPFAAGLVILVGVLIERRLRGPRPKGEFFTPTGGAAVAICAHALIGTVICFVYGPFLSYEAFLPSAEEVSMPPGLTAQSTDGYCGSNFCSRTLTIVSITGLPPAEVANRLRKHLVTDGWRPGGSNTLLRRHGWLVDTRLSEIWISESPLGVSVELAGSELTNTDTRP
ncbi:hypothetical protein [Streptomyces sp. CB01881]|uniref:hypothetical protein n=1 Tax=Streptomyces sp. CB01881 TaxID=2078691 RepID=UPI0013870A9F|nr:hypothetical protein [Streptomyces sp. CB01881]